MRPERITLQQAQRCYNSVREQIKLDPRTGIDTLPDIDMTQLFAGRKSMTIESIIAHIGDAMRQMYQ